MKAHYSWLIQSKYYNPAFNSALFDGPFRIYFSQIHESLALKIYYLIQNSSVISKMDKTSAAYKDRNLYIMLYPNQESFDHSFEEGSTSTTQGLCLAHALLENDLIVGSIATMDEAAMQALIDRAVNLMASPPATETSSIPEYQTQDLSL